LTNYGKSLARRLAGLDTLDGQMDSAPNEREGQPGSQNDRNENGNYRVPPQPADRPRSVAKSNEEFMRDIRQQILDLSKRIGAVVERQQGRRWPVNTTVMCTHCKKPNSVNKADGRVQTVRCSHCSELFTEEVGGLSKAEEIGDLAKSATSDQGEGAAAFMTQVREQVATLTKRIGEPVRRRPQFNRSDIEGELLKAITNPGVRVHASRH
jgi:hypothetical protein